MADTIRVMDYYYIEATDKPGEGARVLRHLREAGVNLAVLHAFPSGRRTQIDFVPTSGASLKAAARSAKWKVVGPKKAFVIEGDDRVGALAEYFAMLGDAGVNITAVSAVTAGAGRFGAILWVDPHNVKRTAKLLGAG
ncbi:MAG TPA: hypothetical protein VKZ50_08350 [bacterium]|nr:hypothetical protein [bacterium]